MYYTYYFVLCIVHGCIIRRDVPNSYRYRYRGIISWCSRRSGKRCLTWEGGRLSTLRHQAKLRCFLATRKSGRRGWTPVESESRTSWRCSHWTSQSTSVNFLPTHRVQECRKPATSWSVHVLQSHRALNRRCTPARPPS